jgi:hypothetical protein
MSTSGQTASFDEVWGEVRRWPPVARLSLASQILASLSAEREIASGHACPADLIGAWSSAGPMSDKAVQRVLDEELQRKHG